MHVFLRKKRWFDCKGVFCRLGVSFLELASRDFSLLGLILVTPSWSQPRAGFALKLQKVFKDSAPCPHTETTLGEHVRMARETSA